MFPILLNWAEKGHLPDSLIRLGIRRLLRERRNSFPNLAESADVLRQFLADCHAGPIAAVPELANAQHYEVPAEFFKLTLGTRLKYSCCYWEPGCERLDDAETAALKMTCERADLQDGQQILELGCGWGSLTLWMAERYPQASITAVSNSTGQKDFIEQAVRNRSLTNIRVITADMNTFDHSSETLLLGRFDRVVSVEMFEHIRNHAELMRRISTWLTPTGRLFVHVFCHRLHPYFFVEQNATDWMTRHFFSGGMMPSDALLLYHQQHLVIRNHWHWNGSHYEKTSNAWLREMDRNWEAIAEIFRETYGADASRWTQRWRMFFMACAELFGAGQGEEWFVSHYLFENRLK
ncbi:MAG: cyclopropane-fatty-acyl-phospholipid synthase family protein [Planctomycetaceae bacterium]